MTSGHMLTVAQVAELTGLSAYTIRKAVADTELAASKLRGRIRIAPDDLAAWIDAGRVKPAVSLLVAESSLRPLEPRKAPAGGYREAAKGRRHAA